MVAMIEGMFYGSVRKRPDGMAEIAFAFISESSDINPHLHLHLTCTYGCSSIRQFRINFQTL